MKDTHEDRKRTQTKSALRVVAAMALTVLLCTYPASAQERRGTSFADVDMVRLGPVNGEAYDVYVIGDGSQSYTAQRWITPFELNRYETTYYLWYTVRTKAEKAGYVFSQPGQEGSNGKRGAKPTKKALHQPVTNISWYDAVVWCNAYSEQSGRVPCYSYRGEILRDATDTLKLERAECSWESDGWRLPTESEWEYAARKTATGFQSGGLMSGQINERGESDDSIPEEELAWTAFNAEGTHTVGTAGTPFEQDAQPSPASGNPNGAGLFDMSGNVLEFCWDWMGRYRDVLPGERATGEEAGSQRVCRGGSWSEYTPFCYAGDRYSYDASEYYPFIGFRLCRTVRYDETNGGTLPSMPSMYR